jgi:hypothetical protein
MKRIDIAFSHSSGYLPERQWSSMEAAFETKRGHYTYDTSVIALGFPRQAVFAYRFGDFPLVQPNNISRSVLKTIIFLTMTRFSVIAVDHRSINTTERTTCS